VRKKPRLVMTNDEYVRMSGSLVLKIKEFEQDMTNPQHDEGIQQRELVDWYLWQNQKSMNSVEACNQLEKLLKVVINRLVDKERLLIVVEERDGEDNRKLKTHPNQGEL
jgi:hypothetical protein